jgi:peptide/nickel transport system ATP-binding protein
LGDDDIFAFSEISMRKIRGKRISMIFQEPMTSLNPVMTIGEQIIEVLKLHFPNMRAREAKRRLIELLESVKFPEPEQRTAWYPHQLSGGMKQRVMIAMALACEPALVIADEPTTALDVTVQRQIIDLIKALQKERNLSILLITHDLSVVAKMADRVGVMRDGQILEQATADDFFRTPKHSYSRQLLKSVLTRRNEETGVEQSQSPLLELENLKVYFPVRKGLFRRVVDQIKAVDEISLKIERGKTLAIVGESGSGKTTVANSIVRLIEPTEGEIRFDGEDRLSLSKKQLRQRHGKDVQMIFQDPYSSLNPRMRVGEIIEEGMQALDVGKSHKERQAQIDTILDKVGLEPEQFRSRFPHELSGGERQRTAIARALTVKPKLIICDEPTSALDMSIRSQIVDILRMLQRNNGITYLLITHDMSVVGNFADRVAVMYQGKIVEEGTVSDIFDNPQQEYTKELLGSVLTVVPTNQCQHERDFFKCN